MAPTEVRMHIHPVFPWQQPAAPRPSEKSKNPKRASEPDRSETLAAPPLIAPVRAHIRDDQSDQKVDITV
jgi:hypothetical protein